MTWTRRVFIRETFVGWLGLLIGPAVYGTLRLRLTEAGSSLPAELSLGDAQVFKAGTSRVVRFGREKVIVVRAKGGSLSAVSGVCTHLGCSIRYESDGGTEELRCNCHKSRFGLDGGLISGPAQLPLHALSVSIRNGEVVLTDLQKDPNS